MQPNGLKQVAGLPHGLALIGLMCATNVNDLSNFFKNSLSLNEIC